MKKSYLKKHFIKLIKSILVAISLTIFINPNTHWCN